MIKLICNECCYPLRENDRDFEFPGKGEIWYQCDNCGASYSASIRFFKIFKFYKIIESMEDCVEVPATYGIVENCNKKGGDVL